MTCRDCNENLEGDGYTTVVRCPNMSDEDLLADDGPEYAAPDEGPFFCGHKEESEDADIKMRCLGNF